MFALQKYVLILRLDIVKPTDPSLARNFYQQRVDRKRQAERAKKLREQMRDPNFFPSVPKEQP